MLVYVSRFFGHKTHNLDTIPQIAYHPYCYCTVYRLVQYFQVCSLRLCLVVQSDLGADFLQTLAGVFLQTYRNRRIRSQTPFLWLPTVAQSKWLVVYPFSLSASACVSETILCCPFCTAFCKP